MKVKEIHYRHSPRCDGMAGDGMAGEEMGAVVVEEGE